MPLRATTIRFDTRASVYIAKAAQDIGVSVSQFVREAALIRALLVMEQTEKQLDDRELARWRALAERCAELARVDNHDEGA